MHQQQQQLQLQFGSTFTLRQFTIQVARILPTRGASVPSCVGCCKSKHFFGTVNNNGDEKEEDDDDKGKNSKHIDSSTNTTTKQQPQPQQSEMSTDWIPPPPRAFENEDQTLSLNPYNDANAQQQQRLIKQQVRIDQMYAQQEDALLQLTEQEMESLSEDEILRRVEEVLAKEEALEEASFYQELRREEQQESATTILGASVPSSTTTTDWLQTRRAALGRNTKGANSSNLIPVIPHQLLSVEELQTLLESQGGSNVVVLMDDPDYPRMGGAQGMIICTAGSSDDYVNDADGGAGAGAVNPFVINTLTRILIDHLKDRQLDELGVQGAQMGTNHLTPRGTANTQRSMQSTWHVVDCGNFIVHIMDAYTRNHLKLEDLWSGKDPLWKLEYWNEEAIDEYCQKHPVPAKYNGGNGESTLSASIWDPSLVRRLERNQFSSSPFPSHRPVISNATKRRDRRAGRRKRREQRQEQYRQQQQGGY
jgi:Ribosomal silencing factor during starvation